MKLLLDTHVFLWCLGDPAKLSAKERTAVRDPDNELYLSLASAWEIEIKRGLGKLDIPDEWTNQADSFGIRWLPVRLVHIRELASLPHHHRDPFDRILVAQSRIENLRLLTHDPVVRKYLPESTGG